MSKKNDLIKRITIDPEINFGKPSIRNMRYPVELILDLLAAGMSNASILKDYPPLEQDDIFACLMFASKMLSVRSVDEVVNA